MRVVFLSLLLVIFVSAEQSVYSDSDFIDSDVVTKKNSREIFILKQSISQLKEKIEGLKSVIEGQANTIDQLKAKNNNNLESVINELSQRVATLESKPAQIVKTIVSQPASSSTTSSSSSVGEKVSLSSETKTKKSSIATEVVKKPKQEKPKSSKVLFKEAVLNFNRARLTKAQKEFETLKSREYKRASVNFYLGEIAFKRSKYKKAIEYYQGSASLNENASYMDKLLLHTAISLKKKGKAKEAKTFFNAVVVSYPDSSVAKEAKKYLK